LSGSRSVTLLRSRIVLPLRRPAIADGAVVISGSRIRTVGRWEDLRRTAAGTVCDLGAVALLPGLINAHCHLEYTDLAGEFLPPRHFSDWLKLIVAAKGTRPDADFARAWQRGASQLLLSGTTTVADIVAVPKIQPQRTPLRIFSFLEMTGVKSQLPPQKIIAAATAKIRALQNRSQWAGYSPHAPYSTTAELLRLTAQAARKHRCRVATHVAESPEEMEMFRHASGQMHDWLKSQRDCADCGEVSPVQHLARCGLLRSNLLAIHANCLGPGDIAALAKNRVSVVHCPRSHRFFGHPNFRFKDLIRAGVNVCLGTDSLASMDAGPRQPIELNMFSELQSFARNHRDTPPAALLPLVTCNGAQALGLTGKIGEISPGAFADLIAIPCAEKRNDAPEAVVNHRGPVAASMINGRWVIPPE
jgi:cytosine/adenosine deaminase-related metal-dependent hydrolase